MGGGAAFSRSDGSPKRRQIVTAAERLFLAHGYGAVSMDAIARAAQVSKATLYAHFASKDALFAGVVAEVGSDNPVAGDLFPTDNPDLLGQLRRIGHSALHFMLRERTLSIYRVTMAETARFPELGRVFYENGPQRFRQMFQTWVAGQVARGVVTAEDPSIASDQFMALLRCGVFFRASLSLQPPPTDAEIDATVEAAVATWLKAFAAPAG
ncbi:MAG: TetR/AcrR family transcriptional regulator [Acidisphaera sp.]|nr:TetR/AcrR family transcriptional regulator [Acidisphaera sp.]MBV9813016.1 TetR/AcrR family transcriptional regulator [Acetobacteraceae bacterium]